MNIFCLSGRKEMKINYIKKNTLNTIISFLSTIWKNIFIFWSSVNHGILMDIIWVPQFPSKIKHILKVKIHFKVIYHFLQIHQIPSNLNVGWFSFQPYIVVYNILYTGLFLPFPPFYLFYGQQFRCLKFTQTQCMLGTDKFQLGFF